MPSAFQVRAEWLSGATWTIFRPVPSSSDAEYLTFVVAPEKMMATVEVGFLLPADFLKTKPVREG